MICLIPVAGIQIRDLTSLLTKQLYQDTGHLKKWVIPILFFI